MSTFLISDLHFFHKHIIQYENRPFKDLDEMEATLVKNWNNKVKKTDKIFCLGDFAFGNKEMVTGVASKLNGIKHLILGNHDKAHGNKWWQQCGFDFVSRYPLIYKEFFILSHEPVYLNDHMPYVNIHGHLHSNCMASLQYVNVSVECINYTPIDFDLEIKTRFKQEVTESNRKIETSHNDGQ